MRKRVKWVRVRGIFFIICIFLSDFFCRTISNLTRNEVTNNSPGWTAKNTTSSEGNLAH